MDLNSLNNNNNLCVNNNITKISVFDSKNVGYKNEKSKSLIYNSNCNSNFRNELKETSVDFVPSNYDNNNNVTFNDNNITKLSVLDSSVRNKNNRRLNYK